MSAYNWLLTYLGPLLGGLLALLVALAVLTLVLARRLRRLERHYRELTSGTAGGSLEAVLADHVREVRAATGRVTELDALARDLARTSRVHLQRVGFLRFNPFRDAGGDQSFAVALTDADGNGVVISSLHSRDVTRVYGKPLAGWQSPYPLTDEEQQAIGKAKGNE